MAGGRATVNFFVFFAIFWGAPQPVLAAFVPGLLGGDSSLPFEWHRPTVFAVVEACVADKAVKVIIPDWLATEVAHCHLHSATVAVTPIAVDMYCAMH